MTTPFDVFNLRMFYLRARNFKVDGSTPQYLTLVNILLTPDTILEVNGRSSSSYSNYAVSLLQRDRVDKRSEEVTFLSTDSIKMSGSVRFEVYDGDYLLLAGILELSKSDSFTGETKCNVKKCIMKFHSLLFSGTGFLQSKQYGESKVSMVDVFAAGCLSGKPIILSKTLQQGFSKKRQLKAVLDTILEDETTATDNFELCEYETYYSKSDFDGDYEAMYSKVAQLERDGEEHGEELSWFNAGVRVGVGVGFGVCLGVALGVGLLVRTYQASALSFKRRFVWS